ncbi:MAG: antitoxin MazE family protein [Roseiarcus sp.]
MPRSTRKPAPPAKRMASYRQRMRASGLRPVQIWAPDTRSPDFVATCRQQARAVAAGDPAGDEIMRFVASVYEWPEP